MKKDSIDMSRSPFVEGTWYEWDTTEELHGGDETMWEKMMGQQTKQETIHVQTRNKKRSRTEEPIQAEE